MSVFFCACFRVINMNEFFLASNRSAFKDEIEIRQVMMKDFDQWSEFAEPIRIMFNNNFSDEVFVNVFEKLKFQVIMVASLVTNVSDLDPKLLENDGELLELFKNLVEVNQAYFNQENNKKTDSKEKYTWFDSFQYLISKGHRHLDILNYSFGTFKEYLKAAQRNERNSLLSMGNNMRVAYHADKKGFNKYIDSMNKG